VLRDVSTTEEEFSQLGYTKYEQLNDHKMHLSQNDRIIVHKDFVNKLNLEKAKAYRLPYFFKGDDFLE
jgi:hypothetical protein